MTNLEMTENPETVIEEDNADRTPCSLCGRKFLADRLDKHITICQKLKEKKRKTFDAAKQRAENLDKINQGVPTLINVSASKPALPPKGEAVRNAKKKPVPVKMAAGPNGTAKESSKSKKANWKVQHEEFIRTIRAARGAEVSPKDDDNEGEEEDAGKGGSRSKSLPRGMVECPSCGRRFNERAADRHIAWCSQKTAKEDEQRRNSQKDTEALERMKARTKYKPPTLAPGTGNSNGQGASRSRSTSKGKPSPSKAAPAPASTRTASTSSRQSAETTRTSSSTSTITRKYTRNISKSTESLSTTKTRPTRQVAVPVRRAMAPVNHGAPPGSTASRASIRTDASDTARNRDTATQRTVVLRRVGGQHKNATSKINTGLSTSRNTSPVKSAAPVMKFKEKFPNHQVRTSAAEFDFEILRRNSTEAYDDSPKTVPGVRTGGVSPVKSSSGNINGSGSSLSRSEMSLKSIGGDIKKRIDMYISGLYDNELYSHYAGSVSRFVDEHLRGREHLTEAEFETLKQESMASMGLLEGQTQMPRPHSVNSDLSVAEARGSTSDSTDSGLGAYGLNCSLESAGKATSGTYPTAEILSPPMSELERRSRLMLRNGSLNDIHHLMGQQESRELSQAHEEDDGSTLVLPNYYADEVDLPIELTPRFCHSCGTKYPNTLAKFCCECGNRRVATAVEH